MIHRILNWLMDWIDDRFTARRAAKLYEEYKHDPSVARSYDEIHQEMVRDGLIDEDDK